MEEIGVVVALVVGVAVIFFVPFLVWSTVIAGLYRIVRDKAREWRQAVVQKVSRVSVEAE
ncbi:MAG: hypothetical protein JW900_08460 [Anaerolineae bacterium]|nr:hypothetical protein [Anaerolineae bacterium]